MFVQHLRTAACKRQLGPAAYDSSRPSPVPSSLASLSCSNALTVNLQLSPQSVSVGASMSITWGGRQLSLQFQLPTTHSIWQLVEEVRCWPRTAEPKAGACSRCSGAAHVEALALGCG